MSRMTIAAEKHAAEVTLFLAGLLALGACTRSPAPTEPADLVLKNGTVVTMEATQPQVEALAIRGEHILALGTDAEMELLVGPETRVIDLAGRMAVPGLIEGHGHFMSLGESLANLDLKEAATWDEIVAQVGEAVAAAEPGEFLTSMRKSAVPIPRRKTSAGVWSTSRSSTPTTYPAFPSLGSSRRSRGSSPVPTARGSSTGWGSSGHAREATFSGR